MSRDERGSSASLATVLEVTDLRIEFQADDAVVKAVNGVTFGIGQGETLALVGESGSGKSVTAQGIVGVLDMPPAVVAGGRIEYRGQDLLQASPAERRAIRGQEIALILQDALTALDPRVAVGEQIAEALRLRRKMSRREARAQAVSRLEDVRIPDAARRARQYPHQFSGGMRQRVLIALALALEPRLIIADEPTTALDVTVQAEIMDLLAELQRRRQLSLLLITHDLAAVAEWADRVMIMYAGRIVESGTVADVYRRPAHPYTLGLINSVPGGDGSRLDPIPGAPPDLRNLPAGCPFHPRCAFAKDVCREERPPLRTPLPGRTSECHFVEEVMAHDR
jgi:oligopeptide transport system ATP-binding protein